MGLVARFANRVQTTAANYVYYLDDFEKLSLAFEN
jgi:hypothetical protein